MTKAERLAIGELWLGLALVYGKIIPDAALRLMLDAVGDCPGPAVLAFLRAWPAQAKAERHPYPHEVRAAVFPEPDSKFVALDLARKIDKAISRHGYTWEGGYFSVKGRYWEAFPAGQPVSYHHTFQEAVIAELGEIGWHAICSRGGWQAIHSSQRDMAEGQFIAQLRDQVQASYALAKEGVDVTRMEMPERIDRNRGEALLGEFLAKHKQQREEHDERLGGNGPEL